MKERPKFYPSAASMIGSQKTEEFSMRKETIELLKNKNYICMIISFNMFYGVYTCLGAIINNLVEPFGYTPIDTSIFGATMIFCGLVGSIVMSHFMDKTKKYLRILRICCFGSVISTCLFFFTLPSESVILLDSNIAFLGFFMIPIIPIGYSFSVELTHPVSEAMSNGLMVFFS